MTKDNETLNDTPPSDKESVSETGTLSDAMQDITASMPDISSHVVELQQEAKTERENEVQNQPEKKRGRGRPKKTDSPQSNQSRPQSRIGGNQSQNQQQNAQEMESQKMMATAVNAVSQLVQVSGFIVAGADGAFKPEEKMIVEGAFENYFKQKGVVDLPPSIALGLCLMPYYCRILTTKPAQTKLSLGFAWIKNKLSNMSRKRNNAAQPDIGNDNERKNNAR